MCQALFWKPGRFPASWSFPTSQGRRVLVKQMNTRCERRGRKVNRGRGWDCWGWGVLLLMGGMKTVFSQEVMFKDLNEVREQARCAGVSLAVSQESPLYPSAPSSLLSNMWSVAFSQGRSVYSMEIGECNQFELSFQRSGC